MKTIASTIISLAFFAIAFAPTIAHAAGLTPEAKISRINVAAAGSNRILRIELKTPRFNPDNCTGTFTDVTAYPSALTLIIRELDDSKASAQFLSTVQLAFATDASVSFWLVGCTSVGANYWGATWPVPSDIYVRR